MLPRRASAFVIAMLAVARSAVADPGTAQLAPTRSDREDAHRLDVQRHELERGGPPAPVPVPAVAPSGHGNPNLRRAAGVGLVAVAAGSLLTSVVFFALPPSPATGSDAGNTGGLMFLGIGIVAGAIGGGLLLSSHDRTLTVAPAAGSGGMGLVISGRL